VTVHNPDIGGLLPVFVKDEYPEFEVKTFREFTTAELASYIEANTVAVRGLAASLGGFDAALANHLIMAPTILARAGLRYALKVHGSDLSYAVLPELERFGPYVDEALSSANGILVGSNHVATSLYRVVRDSATQAKVRLGPPGVDTTSFAPLSREARAGRLRALAAWLEVADSKFAERNVWDRNALAAAAAVRWFADTERPRVAFIGKLIVSKGIDLLLAAWPLVHVVNPGARLIVVGFGGAAEAVQGVWAAMEQGDLRPMRELADRGRGVEGGPQGRLAILSSFVDRLPDGYLSAARGAAGSVRFAGRLEHDEVGALLATCDSLVFPSTFPEAFGMVIAEAASAGVLPVSAFHSGAAEVSAVLADDLPAWASELLAFPLDKDAVVAMADRVNRWLALPASMQATVRGTLRDVVVRRWSWFGVAHSVLAAAAGELYDLPRPVPPGPQSSL
jgi:glycosyltransferase involved in cell wall biosynthesis